MNDTQRQYFDEAYRTGSDMWTHIPYHDIALGMLEDAPSGSMVLDVGSGRGLWARRLVEDGHRVLGIDTIDSIVDKANEDLKFHNITDQARFRVGSVLDIPFTDTSFDLVTDIGLMQHLPKRDWPKYLSEINRVLKPGGYVLNVTLSRETPQFMGFKPITSDTGEFEKFGVSYYFFRDGEIRDLFGIYFEIIEQKTQLFPGKSDPEDEIVLLFTLMKKK